MSRPIPIDTAVVRVPRSYLVALSAAADSLANLIEGDGLMENVIRDARAVLAEVDAQDKRLSKEVKEALGLWE
jgi:hypothetical protein